MRLSDFEYELPPELIAQHPAARPPPGRRVGHGLGAGGPALGEVADLGRHLRAGDLLVLNDTRVLPARLFARRATGGRVELLFVEPTAAGRWRAMARPAKKLKVGERLEVAEDIGLRLVERCRDEDGGTGPLWELEVEAGGPGVEALLEAHGAMPLPPYIERGGEAEDLERYQTVYAERPGAVAAPTAGLHFTPELLAELEAAGVETARVTLHVGLGTFLPVTVEDIDEHRMHSERYELSPQTVAAVAAARARGGRVIAVGTTSVRVLESCAGEDGDLRPGSGRTEIFIRPGHRFRAVDGLLTNFHLPGSTLLMLVAALVGLDVVRGLYRRAIEERLRFYSYGDAMLLLP